MWHSCVWLHTNLSSYTHKGDDTRPRFWRHYSLYRSNYKTCCIQWKKAQLCIVDLYTMTCDYVIHGKGKITSSIFALLVHLILDLYIHNICWSISCPVKIEQKIFYLISYASALDFNIFNVSIFSMLPMMFLNIVNFSNGSFTIMILL